MINHYIVVDRVVIPCDLMTWARWIQNRQDPDGIVGLVRYEKGLSVSTVFIGVENLFFETMIFVGPKNLYSVHTQTWTEAAEAHAKGLRRLRALLQPPKATRRRRFSDRGPDGDTFRYTERWTGPGWDDFDEEDFSI